MENTTPDHAFENKFCTREVLMEVTHSTFSRITLKKHSFNSNIYEH